MNKIQLAHISEMEKILNESSEILENLENCHEKWQKNFQNFQKLIEYYSSEDWKDHYENSNKGGLPKGFPHGVLSEDAVYNLLVSNRNFALEIAKTALLYLK